ncbi:MAG: hypothetical protein OER85_04605 [Gammaproteobacteria bacterium]|nr:hypothetical protein [Gammaproteobacteria bacterium]
MTLRATTRWCCLMIGLTGLTACAPLVTTADGNRIRTNSAEFRDYAAQVFRVHNEITATLAYTLDDLESSGAHSEAVARLIDADDRMQQACYAVNEIAIARRDEQKVPLKQLKRAAELVPGCENATLEAKKLIADVDSG